MELLDYNPSTGQFTWLVDKARVRIGDIAGSLKGDSGRSPRIKIKLDQRDYSAHRLAWLYMTGKWPKDQIDHIDGNAANNAFHNLREATNSQNHMNKISKNITGFKGVRYDGRRNNWCATIKLRGKSIFLGSFNSPQDAYEAYCAAATVIHGEFARVR